MHGAVTATTKHKDYLENNETCERPSSDEGERILGKIFFTVKPCNNGFEGTNKCHLLYADFCYCKYGELKE